MNALFLLLAQVVLPDLPPPVTLNCEPTLAVAPLCQCAAGDVCTCADCDCATPATTLVSVVKPKMDLADLLSRPKSVGYGAPETRVPVPDDYLVAYHSKAQVPLAPIDRDHKPTKPVSTKRTVPPPVARAPVQTYSYGSACANGQCGAPAFGRRFGIFRRR